MDFRLTPQERKLATQLYRQQMWLWGKDIRYPEGNLLKTYGYAYRRDVEEKRQGSSRYDEEWTSREGQTITLSLWSFGVTVASGSHRILLERHQFRPRWVAQEIPLQLYRPHELISLKAPSTPEERVITGKLLVEMARRIARYEHWVNHAISPTWRSRVVEASTREFVLPVSETEKLWRELAEQWAQRLEQRQNYTLQRRGSLAFAKSVGLGVLSRCA